MADKVGIANQALKLCGASRITSFEDDTPEGESIRTFYGSSKETVLAAFPWYCAKERASLAASPAAPVFGFSYEYALPDGFLNVVELKGYGPYDDWSREGNKFLSNQAGPLQIVYTTNVAESLMTPDLVKALAAYLGAELALDLMESSSRHDNLMQRYTMALDQAQMNNSRSRRTQQIMPVGHFRSARNMGAG